MKTERREFLKKAACAALTLPIMGQLTLQPSFAAEELKEVSSDDPTAKALGYHSDAATVDPKAFPKRSGTEGAKQLCSTCILLVQTGLSIPGKEGVYGKCSVIQTGLVNAKGWCNSWVQKPGT